MIEQLPAPILFTTLTVGVFFLAQVLYHRTRWLLLNPVLVSVVTIIAFLYLTKTPFDRYREGVEVLNFLLGMALVSLGVNMYEHIQTFRAQLPPIVLALIGGSVVGSLSVTFIAHWMGADHELLATIAPKSATTPISIAIAAKTGGIVPLTAALTISNGIFGAVFGPSLLNFFRIRDPLARGLAIGAAAHGIGTARMAEEGSLTLAAGSLAIALNGLLTALITPWTLLLF